MLQCALQQQKLSTEKLTQIFTVGVTTHVQHASGCLKYGFAVKSILFSTSGSGFSFSLIFCVSTVVEKAL